ncbi:MAG: hypothetical protein KDC98_22160, partial [Planctomycetes bacterium]|nr:hypothetical protein [Planctomycetota bacterium]
MPFKKSLITLPLIASSLLAQQPYGDPTVGSGGFAPRLSAAGSWLGNTGFGFEVQGGLGGSLAGVLIGTAADDLPMLGFDLLLDPVGYLTSILTPLSGSGPGTGQGFAALPLAPAPAFVGAVFRAQAVILDGGAPGGSFAASQGVRFELGHAPLIFVGCSIAANDPFQLIDPASGTIVDSGSPGAVNNTTAAVFGHGGTRLYVSSSIAGTVAMADVSTLPATWSTVFSGGGSCYGLAYDPRRDWLWTLTNPGSGTRELCAIDLDEGSATFGQIAANTVNVS